MSEPIVELEGKFEFIFTGARDAFVFDERVENNVHCHRVPSMNAVDIFVDFNDSFWFVEVKDTANTRGLKSDLKYKFWGSLLYRFAEGKARACRDYHYICLITECDPRSCERINDALLAEIPVHSCDEELPKGWMRPLARSCRVVNCRGWQELYGKEYGWHVTRLPQEN